MRAMLTRKGDYSVPLSKRANVAQSAGARIFVSIHADSLPRSRARGASVYALSLKGATSRLAKQLAQHENASNYIAGYEEIKDPLVKMVVNDLQKTGNIAASIDLGRDILRGLGPVTHIHLTRVEQAGFAVLKSQYMESVLVETAFISNPSDEKKLRTRRFQRGLARGIFNGIKRYVKRKGLRSPPRAVSRDTASNLHKERKYVVRRGDTLSQIARRYGVKAETIKLANNMRSMKLKAGESLLIPDRVNVAEASK